MREFSKVDKIKFGMFIALCILFGSAIFGNMLNLGPVLSELMTTVGTLLALVYAGPKVLGMKIGITKIKRLS